MLLHRLVNLFAAEAHKIVGTADVSQPQREFSSDSLAIWERGDNQGH